MTNDSYRLQVGGKVWKFSLCNVKSLRSEIEDSSSFNKMGVNCRWIIFWPVIDNNRFVSSICLSNKINFKNCVHCWLLFFINFLYVSVRWQHKLLGQRSSVCYIHHVVIRYMQPQDEACVLFLLNFILQMSKFLSNRVKWPNVQYWELGIQSD